MRKILTIFALSFFAVFVADQAVKWFFVATNFHAKSEFIDLVLTYNRGVAFSMFASLGEWLKFIQILLVLAAFSYLYYEKILLGEYRIELGAIFGAGCSNIIDRFMHGGVVDYVFWHKWFEFAIFNLADVIINVAVFVLILRGFVKRRVRE